MKAKPLLCLLLLAGLLLPSCRAKTYRSDLSAADLTARCAGEIALNDPVFAGAEQFAPIPESFGADPEISVVYAASGNCLDEIGVWNAGEGNAQSVAVFLRARFAESYENDRAYYDSYMPEETPKLRDAEVRVYGSYVVYAILNEDCRKAFFGRMESLLTAP